MNNVKLDDFVKNAEKYLTAAVAADEFVSVETSVGRAVVISESEWDMLKQFAEICIKNPTEISRLINK